MSLCQTAMISAADSADKMSILKMSLGASFPNGTPPAAAEITQPSALPKICVSEV
jgi:hypothetical protein